MFKEDAPWITIAHSVRFDPVRKEVIGYKMDATALQTLLTRLQNQKATEAELVQLAAQVADWLKQ